MSRRAPTMRSRSRHLLTAIAAATTVAGCLLAASNVLVAPGGRGGTRAVRIAFVFSDGNISGTVRAFKSVLEDRRDLRGRVALTFLTESVFDDVKPADLTAADVLVLDIMNQQMLDRFNATHKIDV